MTGPLAPYIRPNRGPERTDGIVRRKTAAGHRAVTQSTRAVTQSVVAVAEILRSAKRPAIFAEGLMPSRLRRWWWKAGDLAWNVVGAIGVVVSIVALAFVTYVLVTIAIDALFG